MNKTSIEWTQWTWNPWTGCNHQCELGIEGICYAKQTSRRLKGRFGYPDDDPFRGTFHPERLNEPDQLKTPSKIFEGSMGDKFTGTYTYIGLIHAAMRRNPRHTFQSLTKQYEMLDQFTFPPNLWQGISILRNALGLDHYIEILSDCDASVKFISFEPLLGEIHPNLSGIDWVIIGAQTKPNLQPKKEWVGILLKEAESHDIPVFLKNNLEGFPPRKEYPSEREGY